RYLDWILAPHSRRRLDALDAWVRVLLRMTAYQLVFLERVPAFAAVNDAVTLARSGARGAAEYTNAVLRAFAKRGAREREPAPPRDPTDALATRCSFPTWLAARWVTRYGAAEAEALMRAMNERPPLTLRANTLRLSREALAARLAAEDDVATRPTSWAPEGLVTERASGAPGARDGGERAPGRDDRADDRGHRAGAGELVRAPRRRPAGGRALHEPRRAAAQSGGEVAAAARGHRRQRRAPARDPDRRGHPGEARRAPGVRDVLARARGERGGGHRAPHRAAGL